MKPEMDFASMGLGRRELNKLDKMRRIVAAARELFNEKGFELTTTQEVADRAGVGAGTLFLYVSTKEDLLVLAFLEEIAGVMQRAEERLDTTAPFVEQVTAFFGTLLDYHAANAKLSRNLLREMMVLRNPDRHLMIARLPMPPMLRGIVERSQALGELRDDVDAVDISRLMFAMFWDCLRDWSNGGLDVEAFRGELRRMIELQVQGVGGDAARPAERSTRSRRRVLRPSTRRRQRRLSE